MSDREFGGSDDLTLPKATISKIICEILALHSPGLAFGKDARDLLIDCSVEFVTLISSESNDIAEAQAKKTIAAEHVEQALRDLGFPEYVSEVLTVAEDYKRSLQVRDRKAAKLKQNNFTEEELLRQQQELFRSAGDKYHAGTTEEAEA